jgi:DNA-binding transcriptional LysR family regulator
MLLLIFMGEPTMDRIERVSRRLKVRDLQLFEAVVRCGSMAKAAGHMNLSQPAVSKAITELERAFGVRLLDRSMRGVEPTRYGQALLKRGTAIFDEIRHGVKEIEFLADPTAGELRVGCGEVFTAGLLPAVIERLGRQYPGIVCYVESVQTISTLEFRELRERRVDLAVVRIPEGFEEDDLSADILFYEHVYIVSGKQQMGPPAPYRTCGFDRRALASGSAQYIVERYDRRGVYSSRIKNASAERLGLLRPPAQQSDSDRQILGLPAGFILALWRHAICIQGPASAFPGQADADCHPYSREPNAEPGGPALH